MLCVAVSSICAQTLDYSLVNGVVERVAELFRLFGMIKLGGYDAYQLLLVPKK